LNSEFKKGGNLDILMNNGSNWEKFGFLFKPTI